MPADEFQKYISNVGRDIFTKRWVEPNDISLPGTLSFGAGGSGIR